MKPKNLRFALFEEEEGIKSRKKYEEQLKVKKDQLK